MRRASLLVPVIGALLATAAPAGAQQAGRAFAPPPLPNEAPYAMGETVVHDVLAGDGTPLRIETTLPGKRPGGPAVPAQMPTVVHMSPYHLEGFPWGRRALFVTHGFAWSAVHIRGTGASKGCWAGHDEQQADDGARVLEWLGSQAPWSDGKLGMVGLSHDGGTQLNVAGRGDRHRLRFLRAIAPGSPFISTTDLKAFDGVPIDGAGLTLGAFDTVAAHDGGNGAGAPPEAVERDPVTVLKKLECRPPALADLAELSGNHTARSDRLEVARHAATVAVPTLFTTGSYEIQNRQLVGVFDRLGRDVAERPQRVGIFQVGEHSWPDLSTLSPIGARIDTNAMLVAWFDHHLRGARNGVDGWPVAQTQDTTGQWRAVKGWPRSGEPRVQLALGPDGRLGASTPGDRLALDEASPGTLTWSTPRLSGPLTVSGMPVLDVWVTTDRPDGHLTAALEAFDAGGKRIPSSRRIGARSLQHLDPFVNGRFLQSGPKPAPVDVPIRVRLRFEPADLVVPEGGTLRLTLGTGGQAWEADQGLNAWFDVDEDGTTDARVGAGWRFLPSGSGARITVLLDCGHRSLLRFSHQRKRPDRIDVAESAGEVLGEEPGRPVTTTGGGLARARAAGC